MLPAFMQHKTSLTIQFLAANVTHCPRTAGARALTKMLGEVRTIRKRFRACVTRERINTEVLVEMTFDTFIGRVAFTAHRTFPLGAMYTRAVFILSRHSAVNCLVVNIQKFDCFEALAAGITLVRIRIPVLDHMRAKKCL